MTAVTCTNTHAAKRVFPPMAWFVHMFEVRRERLALAQLDTSRLNDIGLTQAEAMREANRPLWDVPAYWN